MSGEIEKCEQLSREEALRAIGENAALHALIKVYEEALVEIRDMDFRGNRHQSHFIATEALED